MLHIYTYVAMDIFYEVTNMLLILSVKTTYLLTDILTNICYNFCDKNENMLHYNSLWHITDIYSYVTSHNKRVKLNYKG